MGLFSCLTTSNELICTEVKKTKLIQCEHKHQQFLVLYSLF
uniref:Uncharacterized protein n=1 Tax=Arundo donax TaxID=35708 RepID=A0A0A9H1H6_ARUDO